MSNSEQKPKRTRERKRIRQLLREQLPKPGEDSKNKTPALHRGNLDRKERNNRES